LGRKDCVELLMPRPAAAAYGAVAHTQHLLLLVLLLGVLAPPWALRPVPRGLWCCSQPPPTPCMHAH
jgi:hypothetical protein